MALRIHSDCQCLNIINWPAALTAHFPLPGSVQLVWSFSLERISRKALAWGPCLAFLQSVIYSVPLPPYLRACLIQVPSVDCGEIEYWNLYPVFFEAYRVHQVQRCLRNTCPPLVQLPGNLELHTDEFFPLKEINLGYTQAFF